MSFIYGVAIVFGLCLSQVLYLQAVMAWTRRKTDGLGYYGRPPAWQRRLKSILKVHRFLLTPIIWALSRTVPFDFRNSVFHFRGVPGPHGSCSEQTFERATQYVPKSTDVFVATQMKSGTTWMQHLVLQIVSRGQRDLASEGTQLYAVSPWLESSKSVPISAAPLVGEGRPARIIKTHLPAALCPYSACAKYIYVVRHPVSCFASCVDFVRSNLRGLQVPLERCEAWYLSDELMWWTSWPTHVGGWWDQSARRPNLLLVRFEEMKRDLAAVARKVADFLDVPVLDPDEMSTVLSRCSFQYMQQHADIFEMQPPHLMRNTGSFFVRGNLHRFKDVPADVADRILLQCTKGLAELGFSMDDLYPRDGGSELCTVERSGGQS